MATHDTGGEPANQGVQDVAATAKEDVRNATDRILDRGRDEAKTILEQQQRRAADGLTGVADALHAAADRMEGSEIGFVARYAETAADQVETWARRVQQRDIDDVLSEAENYARRNPEIFVGGAFFAGFLVARVAKASSDRRRLRERAYRQEMESIGRQGVGSTAGPTGAGGPRGYGYAGGGGYPGGIAGDAGARGSTTTAGATDMRGDAALSATTGPNTPARTSGSPATGGAAAGGSGGGDLRQGGGANPHSGTAPEQRGGEQRGGAGPTGPAGMRSPTTAGATGIGTGPKQTETAPATPTATPNPGASSATETAATGSPFAAAGSRTVSHGPGSQGPQREATPSRPNETGGQGGKGDRK